MVCKGQKVLIGTTMHGTKVYGIVKEVYPQKLYALTEREAPYGNIIRECVMVGKRRGQFVNRTIGGWDE